MGRGRSSYLQNRPIRLLTLTTTFPRHLEDTTPAFVYELCDWLANHGIDTTVLAPHDKDAQLTESMGNLKIRRFPYFYPTRYQRLCYNGGILPNLRRSHLAKLQLLTLVMSETYHSLKICRSERVNLIHSHWIVPSGFVGATCKRILGIRHLSTIHAADIFGLEKIPLRRNIAAYVVRNSDHITVVSTHIKERLLRLLPSDMRAETESKLQVIPMGIHTKLFENSLSPTTLRMRYGVKSGTVLLFVGRLAEKKGVPYLIKAMTKITSENSDVTLLVCGEGPMREELHRMTEELGLDRFVTFVGYVTGAKKADYFNMSDIVIVPSIVDDSGDTEGLPVVILEALAAGKPIVASDVGGIKDVIQDRRNGLLIPPKEPDRISASTQLLISESELSGQISSNAKATARDYDWSTIGSKYAEILMSLVGQQT